LRSGKQWEIARWALLISILVLATGLRLHRLWPPETGLLYAPDTDEGVHASNAQLWLQGAWPYANYFMTVPPLTLYLYGGIVRLLFTPWGNPTAFMVLRYLTVALGLGTVAATWCLGRQLSGWGTGLMAASLLAVDGLMAALDRRAMLETLVNLFSLLAVIAYASALKRTESERRRWLCLAGVLAAAAVMSKTAAGVLVVALILHALWRRQIREAAWLLGGSVGGWLLLSLPLLVKAPAEMLKQVYVFQALRPWDGVSSPLSRLRDMWNYPWNWLTVRLGLLGLAAILLRRAWRWGNGLWSAVLLWAGLTLALQLVSGSYWATYFCPLTPPLALLAGGLLAHPPHRLIACSKPRSGQASSDTAPLPLRSAQSFGLGPEYRLLLPIAVILGVVILGAPAMWRQWQATLAALEETRPEYAQMGRYLAENTSPEAVILTLDPVYTFLGGRRLAGPDENHYLLDSYGRMLYVNMGLAEADLGQSLIRLVTQRHKDRAVDVFHRLPAQAEILRAFCRADYVILEHRAERQLAPETLAAIRQASQPVIAFGQAELRRRSSFTEMNIQGGSENCW